MATDRQPGTSLSLQEPRRRERFSWVSITARGGEPCYRFAVTQPVRRPATYDDLLALPVHVVGEIVGGELVVSPRPAAPHAVATSALGATLVPPLQFGDSGPGGWWILDE